MVKFYRVQLKSALGDRKLTSDGDMLYSPPKEYFVLAVNSVDDKEKETERKRDYADKFNSGQVFALFNYNKTLVLTREKQNFKFVKPGDALTSDQMLKMVDPVRASDSLKGCFSILSENNLAFCNRNNQTFALSLDPSQHADETYAWSLEFLDKTVRGRAKAFESDDEQKDLKDLITRNDSNLLEEAVETTRNELVEMAPRWFKSRDFEPLSMAFLIINAIERTGKEMALSGADKKRVALRVREDAINAIYDVLVKRHKEGEVPVNKGVITEAFRGFETDIDNAVRIANKPDDIIEKFKWVSGKFLGRNWF